MSDITKHASDCKCDVCGRCDTCRDGTAGPAGSYCLICFRTQRPFCGCETIRHFDGNAGHPYGQANGSTRPTTVYGLAGEPFCEECQRICEPAILTGKPLPLNA